VPEPTDVKPADADGGAQPLEEKPADTVTQPADQKPVDPLKQDDSAKPADTVTQPVDQQPADTMAAPDKNESHTVIKGDSLWNIAKDILGNGHRFHEIIDLNPELRRHPDRLQPGQMLKMPEVKD
jgi:nucleoid-associated protein YgaU